MIKLIVIALGMAGAITISTPIDGPYKEEATNLIYQLLFCDRPQLFKDWTGQDLDQLWINFLRAMPRR